MSSDEKSQFFEVQRKPPSFITFSEFWFHSYHPRESSIIITESISIPTVWATQSITPSITATAPTDARNYHNHSRRVVKTVLIKYHCRTFARCSLVLLRHNFHPLLIRCLYSVLTQHRWKQRGAPPLLISDISQQISISLSLSPFSFTFYLWQLTSLIIILFNFEADCTASMLFIYSPFPPSVPLDRHSAASPQPTSFYWLFLGEG